MNLIHKIDTTISRAEGFFVTALLSIMISLAFSQAVLRNFFHGGLPWADVFLRNMVLWVCFVGASLASYEKRHINIDILSRFLSDKTNKQAGFFINLFSSLVCGFLTVAAWRFMMDERSGGGILFGDVPTWYFLVIIPVSLSLMCVRFFFYSIKPGRQCEEF